MELTTPYVLYDYVDISDFLSLADSKNILWPDKEADYRSNTFPTHVNTRSILFSWTPRDNWPELTPQRSSLFTEHRVENMYKTVMDIVGAKNPPLNMMLAELAPKKEIHLHVDAHPFFKWARRVHVPIFVPEECLFEVDGQKVPVKPGLVFELANTRPHRVVNESAMFRYHIVMDFQP